MALIITECCPDIKLKTINQEVIIEVAKQMCDANRKNKKFIHVQNIDYNSFLEHYQEKLGFKIDYRSNANGYGNIMKIYWR